MKSRASASPIDGLGPLFLVAPARLTLPDDVLEILTDHVTAQCADPDRVSDADGLAGRIRQGEQINAFRTIPPLLAMYICGCARHYGSQIVRLNGGDLEPEFQISLIDSWIVKQKDGDYNPLHHHAGELSGIIYVSVPKQVSDTSTPDGNLIFAHGQFKLSNLDLLGVREIVPKRGEMFIFPAWMQHAVYPFSGEGERLSYAFNLSATGLRLSGE